VALEELVLAYMGQAPAAPDLRIVGEAS
jgi:hypothetical protein